MHSTVDGDHLLIETKDFVIVNIDEMVQCIGKGITASCNLITIFPSVKGNRKGNNNKRTKKSDKNGTKCSGKKRKGSKAGGTLEVQCGAPTPCVQVQSLLLLPSFSRLVECLHELTSQMWLKRDILTLVQEEKDSDLMGSFFLYH